MPLGYRRAILQILSIKALIDSPFFYFVARRAGTDNLVSSSKNHARKNFLRSNHFLIAPAGSFMNHSKATPVRVSMNKRIMMASFDTISCLGFEIVYMLVWWTFIVEGVPIWILKSGRKQSWIPLDGVWSNHPYFLRIASIWDSLQAFLELIHPLGMIVF